MVSTRSVATYDIVVVGAGIVGLTVAAELGRRHPDSSICVLDKEGRPGVHASGRNSGVMHSGIYYGSDTMKAKVCAEGGRRMGEFARAEGIAYRQDGKVILATDEAQLPTVDKLLQNAVENGIPAERIDAQQVRELEPAATEGPAAIYCPTTAVIDSAGVIRRLHEILVSQGVVFRFNVPVTDVSGEGRISTPDGNIEYGYLVNCAGAYADRVAKLFGLAREFALVPFKGIYWKLGPEAQAKIRANIYPVPDVNMPFLGVHLTRVISDDVYVGPTAIPALGRENYGLLAGARIGEAASIGVHLAGMYIRNEQSFRNMVWIELGKYHKKNFFAAVRKLMPSLKPEDMLPTPKAGIRPQLINVTSRRLEMDYILRETESSLHVLNAISPAFTSSFAFAEMIVDASPLR